MNEFSPEPIAPGVASRRNDEAQDLLSQMAGLSLGARLALAAFMAAMAWSCLWGGFALTSAFHHWIAWAFALVLFEPVGITALLAAVLLVAPASGIARWFAITLRRTRFGLIALAVVFVGWAFSTIVWLLWELYRQRG
jgi:hypothetical protein